MPSAHTPEWSKIRTLKAKLQTGRCTASGGRVGRELTEEELKDCRERLAQLEQKRDQGIEDRRVAKETHDNTKKLLNGQEDILHAINGVNRRLDTVIAPTGSSAHHKLLAKEAAKRERDLEKVRRHLQQGIVPAEGDFYVGTVLVKADALDQLEELRDRDLEAEFSLTGLPCRLVQISGQSGIVHLLAPDLEVLKGKRKDMGFHNMRLQAFHKDLFYETLAWKAGNGPPVLLDGDDKKLPKKACLRLVVPNIVRIALAKLPVVEVLEESGEAPSSGACPWHRAGGPSPRSQAGPLGGGRGRQHHRPEAEPTEQPVMEPAAEAPEPKAPEPEPLSDKAQDLLSSGKEVWAATVSERTVLFEHVRNWGWGPKQPDIVAKLINLQDADTVAAWYENPALPKILVREEEGEIWVSSQFLQAHCKKLSLEMSPRSQRERSRTPPRRSCPLGRLLQVRPAKADKVEDGKPAEDVHMADAQLADDKQPAEDVEMPDAKPEEAEPAAVVEPAAPAPESALPDADDKSADAEPAVADNAGPDELQDRPAEEAKQDAPAAVADATAPEDDVETVHGLRMRRVEGDWYELAARTLDDFDETPKILTPKLKDRTFAEYKLKRGDKGSTSELFEVNWTTGKLWLPKGRRSVLAEEAKVRVRLSA